MGRSKSVDVTGTIVNVLLILLLLSVLFVIVALWQGWISMVWLAGLFGKDVMPDLDDPTYNPPSQVSCSYYDISQEFRNAFGSGNIDVLETNCRAIGGIWYEMDDQMGCWWDPAVFSLDCSQNAVVTMTNFCEGILKANYICDNSVAYAGCNCLVSAPQNWNGQDPDQQQDSEMGEWEPGDVGAVFVSSNVWNGAMGGLSGADSKCSVSASFSGLSGTWRAILSDSNTDARSRLPDISYYNMNGELLASGSADLWDGGLTHAVLYTDKGIVVSKPFFVWTGSTVAGYGSGEYCNNWGYVDSTGTIGESDRSDYTWIDAGSSVCSNGMRIYCARIS